MNVDSLVGTWRLVSFEVLDAEGRRAFPFGKDAVGFITYTADGRIAVPVGATKRPRLTTPDWVGGPDPEIAAAARDYCAYCGTYEVHDSVVVHRVELSLMPDRIGVEQQRHVVLD